MCFTKLVVGDFKFVELGVVKWVGVFKKGVVVFSGELHRVFWQYFDSFGRDSFLFTVICRKGWCFMAGMFFCFLEWVRKVVLGLKLWQRNLEMYSLNKCF